MKKVLVISFNCFDSSSSNGRALGSLLALCDELRIAQIYIKNGTPNFIDGDYCFIDEQSLLKHFFNAKKCTRFFTYRKNDNDKSLECSNFEEKKNDSIMSQKTPFKMFGRNIMWKLALASLKNVFRWALDFNPEYVLIQAGDLPFLLDLGFKIAKICKSKLVFYTSENYPFKKLNYTNLKKKSYIYPFLRNELFKSTKRVVENAFSLIFLTDSLKKEFNENYNINGKAYVIYPCSEMKELPPINRKEQYVFSYCGNLELGRDKTLIDIAKILKKKYYNCKLIVCGHASTEVIAKLENEDNIEYIGIIPYRDVIRIYEKSDFLLHFESFDRLIALDSTHAFSGKIADCISSGRPFIFVGPENMYEYQFLKKTGGALTFNSIELFRKEIFLGVLDTHYFDPNNQMLIKNNYFSWQKTRNVIEEIFDL